MMGIITCTARAVIKLYMMFTLLELIHNHRDYV